MIYDPSCLSRLALALFAVANSRSRRLLCEAMPERHFSTDLFKFLRELKNNNNREWFAENKQRFEESVRGPFLRFIADVAPMLHGISARIVADPRPSGGSLFRIYRDIRFSKDKSPYKTHVAANFPHLGAGSDVSAAGFYLHLEPRASFAAAGVWHPDPATLARVRRGMVERPKEWQAIRRSKLEVHGDKLTRPPKGFDPNHQFAEDLKLKDFISSVRYIDKEVCDPKFILQFVTACRKMSPLVQFLTASLGLEW